MIDAIITLIRGSESADAAQRRAAWLAPFEFCEIQATHILDMPLRRLAAARAPEAARRVRRAAGDDRRARGDPRRRRQAARGHQGRARRGPRASTATSAAREITIDPGDLADLDLIEDEELVVVLSQSGYVKTVAADQFRTQGRGGKGVRGGNLRDEDYVEHLLTTTAHSYLLFFSNRGRVYRLRAHEIPMKDRTARGIALVNLIALQPDEHIEAVIDTRTYEDGAYLFFATRKGIGEEDADVGVRLVAALGPHRDQPQRRRRARAGRPDDRQRRHRSWCRATA